MKRSFKKKEFQDYTTVTLKQQHIHFLPSRDEFTANQGPVKCNEANAGQQERIVQAASENAQDSNKEHISNSNLEQKVIHTFKQVFTVNVKTASEIDQINSWLSMRSHE